jgi:hypothetical protein
MTQLKTKSKLCQSASLSWFQAPIWGPRPDFYYCQTTAGFFYVGPPLWRENGSVVYNCCLPSPAQSFSGSNPAGLMTTFYCLRFETPPTWRSRSPYLYPPGTGWPSYTPRHWVPFSSPPSTSRATAEVFEPASTQGNRQLNLLVLVIWPWYGPHRKRLFQYCVFSRCRVNKLFTGLFPSNGCCTVTCLHSCYSQFDYVSQYTSKRMWYVYNIERSTSPTIEILFWDATPYSLVGRTNVSEEHDTSIFREDERKIVSCLHSWLSYFQNRCLPGYSETSVTAYWTKWCQSLKTILFMATTTRATNLTELFCKEYNLLECHAVPTDSSPMFRKYVPLPS